MPINLNTRAKLDLHVNRVLRSMRNATKETCKKAAEVVAERAKQKVPVKSGVLRESIEGKARKARGEDRFLSTVSTNTKGKTVFEGEIFKQTKKGGKVIGKAAAGARNRKVIKYGYGLDVEIGRPSGNYKSTPYLRPALNESIDDIQKIMKEETAKEAAIK